jgi:hypothetical protein
MEVKEEMQRILGRPVEDASSADRAREAAEILAEYHRLTERARRLSEEGHARGRSEGRSLAGLTLHEAARRVLEDAGVPLHARELGARIKAGGWRHPRSARARSDQIVYQLAARLPRHPQTFRRIGPNTFGLVVWGSEGPPKRQRPRTGVFTGPGGAIARRIGESDEPVSEREAAWRSS